MSRPVGFAAGSAGTALGAPRNGPLPAVAVAGPGHSMRPPAPLLTLAALSVAAATWFTTAVAGEITLGLLPPDNCECGWVSVNGYVASTDRVLGMVWDWGDGSRDLGWFPTPHRYASDGVYEVGVTAVDCAATRTETVTVTVTNASGTGCPMEASAPCSDPCYEMSPLNMHMVEYETSAAAFDFHTGWGAPVTGAVLYTPSDPTLVTVSGDGHVTALRTESAYEIGSWVGASLDGRSVSNTSVVRVLPTDYGVPFIESDGPNTRLLYPADIGGEDIASLVDLYQVLDANEYAYEFEAELIQARPFDGCRQAFEVDLGASETGRVCGISGNPIRLGWNIEGNAWQNCFLVPFLPPRSPQWFVFYHEVGHNMTWASPVFSGGLGMTVYSEAMASVMSITAMDEMLRNGLRFPLDDPARESLQFVFSQQASTFDAAFQGWLDAGAPFASLDPDIVGGLWLHHAGAEMRQFAARFFLPLEPTAIETLNSVLCAADTDAGRHTFFAALLSAAQGDDLSDTFRTVYHYPIDQALFDTAHAAMSGLIAGEAAGRVPDQTGWPGSPLAVEKAPGDEILLSWDPSCLAGDTDYEIYEGDLTSFYSHEPLICSTSGGTSATFTPRAGSTYYLVVSATPWREGSYGTDSAGNERPDSAGACRPQAIGICGASAPLPPLVPDSRCLTSQKTVSSSLAAF